MIGLQRGTVKLVPYTPEWKRLFEEEKKLLLSSIGNYVIDIQHVGSTAIPGLEAKPIIDIAVAVRSSEDVEKCIQPLEHLGYEYKREDPGRFLFVKGDPMKRTHYVHMVEWNSEFWKNYLLFRDYLHKHKEMANEYAKIKRELAREFEANRGEYTKGKVSFIEKILRMAKREADTDG